MSRSGGRSILWVLGLGLMAQLLGGCGGDDGDRGPQGEAGPPLLIGERTRVPDEVHPQINSVSVSSPLVVDFQITDEFGFGVIGIEGGVDFTVSKLVPGTNGETNNWRTYILADDEGTANAQGGTYSDGTLEDHGNGTYTFTFADELQDISGVSYEPTLTHRVGIELRDVEVLGEVLDGSSNAVHDFQPSTGKTSGITKREIVSQESCKTCHGPDPFSFHGGPRKDVRYCVTCHQPRSNDIRAADGDPDTGPITIDFRVLIHKIHAATDDAIYCGFTCEVLGFAPDDFSDVHFPQDVRNNNCTTCHEPGNAATPQATNVYERPTAGVCTSCHTDLEVTLDGNGEPNGLSNASGNHALGGAQPNENCANCHSAGGGGGLSVELAHEIPEAVWAQRFEYNIISMTNTAETQSPMVTFSVTDPTNGDAKYDLENDPEFTGSETSVNMDIAWPTSDYTNVGAGGTTVTGGPPSRPISIGLVSDAGLGAGVSANGDLTYTVDTSDAAIGLTVPDLTPDLGSGAVVIEGHTSGDFDDDGTYDDSVPVKSVVDYFDIDGTGVDERRVVVDTAKCQDCHGVSQGLAFHGDNRNDNAQVCVVCHNPNQTDLFMRGPAPDGDPDDEANGINTGTPDDLEDRPIDFKYMIHAIHGADGRDNDYVAYGFGVSPHTFTHGIPRPVNDCLICHEDGTYELPLDSGVLGTTLHSGATVTATVGGFANPGATAYSGPTASTDDGSQSDPTDDHNASPTVAVCSSCHDDRAAADHMTNLGNGLLKDPVHYLADNNLDPDTLVTSPDTQADIDAALPIGENCVVCHGAGSIADVAEVHGVE